MFEASLKVCWPFFIRIRFSANMEQSEKQEKGKRENKSEMNSAKKWTTTISRRK